MRWNAIASVLLVVAIASLALNVYQYASPRSVTVTTSNTLLTTCIISGQPGGLQFRVLSDSTLKPVAGVNLTALNIPAMCGGVPATSQATEMFKTNGTEWFRFPSDNNYQYDFVANYLGHTYTFTATLRPISLTCATLFVPSGRTNVTITEFQSVCG